jgi:hypothetical protein
MTTIDFRIRCGSSLPRSRPSGLGSQRAFFFGCHCHGAPRTLREPKKNQRSTRMRDMAGRLNPLTPLSPRISGGAHVRYRGDMERLEHSELISMAKKKFESSFQEAANRRPSQLDSLHGCECFAHVTNSHSDSFMSTFIRFP